jgi:hypothetical protein
MIPSRGRNIIFSTAPRLGLGATTFYPIGISRLFAGSKADGVWSYHLFLSSAKVKNARSYNFKAHTPFWRGA